MSQLADNFVFAEYLDVWGPQASNSSPSVSPSSTQAPRPSSVESQSSGYSSYDDPSSCYTPWSTGSSPVEQDRFYPEQNGYYAQTEIFNPQFYPCAPQPYSQGQQQYPAQPFFYGQAPQVLYGMPYWPQLQGHIPHPQPNYDVCFCAHCMEMTRKSYKKR
ncbi:unnamed protein product [Bursaphelenchus xylophilus]|uniref:(pine wood nematode) hypothetical protein n=1 Tax=Bursaphelenchus xylophilus TaxID=6326 RepID=A0A1I7SRS0_BURXY|nr:unnamed protein product [Bursaphelenchus xylophilus]CAG9101914.1 unnamed protein product [Bursaphelenchus xylophilus]